MRIITCSSTVYCFQVWEIFFPIQSALCDSELDISIYNIWWISFHMYALRGSLATFSFMVDGNLCQGHRKWRKSVWCFKLGNPPKQPPEIALEFFSVKKKYRSSNHWGSAYQRWASRDLWFSYPFPHDSEKAATTLGKVFMFKGRKSWVWDGVVTFSFLHESKNFLEVSSICMCSKLL